MGKLEVPDKVKDEIIRGSSIPFENDIRHMIDEQIDPLFNQMQEGFSKIAETFVSVRKEMDNLHKLYKSLSNKVKSLSSSGSGEKGTENRDELYEKINVIEKTMTTLRETILKERTFSIELTENAYFIFVLEVESATSDITTIFSVLLEEFGAHGSLIHLYSIKQALNSIRRPELSKIVSELIKRFKAYKNGKYDPEKELHKEEEIIVKELEDEGELELSEDAIGGDDDDEIGYKDIEEALEKLSELDENASPLEEYDDIVEEDEEDDYGDEEGNGEK